MRYRKVERQLLPASKLEEFHAVSCGALGSIGGEGPNGFCRSQRSAVVEERDRDEVVSEHNAADPHQRKNPCDHSLVVPGHKVRRVVAKDAFENSPPIVEVEMSPPRGPMHHRIPFGGRSLKRLYPERHALAL